MSGKTNDSVVFIVEDNADLTDVLVVLFESIHQPVQCFNDAKSFLNVITKSSVSRGCILLDIRLPDMSGLKLQEELKRQSIRLPIIFITGYGDVDIAVRAMKAGAFDFITKPFDNQGLIEQVQRAISFAGSQPVTATHKEIVRFNLNSDKLTPREKQVLSCIVAGKMNKEISYELAISMSTVELHRSNIMRKLQMKNLADLIKTYMEARMQSANSFA
jgi:FixJ family two-component response regulator